MTGLDDVPPPLPLKGTSTDYGTLTENLDVMGSPTPPPPPPHQRVSQGSEMWDLPVLPSAPRICGEAGWGARVGKPPSPKATHPEPCL